MTERNVRPATAEDKFALIQRSIVEIAEIIEAFKAAYEDDIALVPVNAIRELNTAAHLAQIIYEQTTDDIQTRS